MASVALIMGLIMSFVHYYSEEFVLRCYHFRDQLVSFTAGISIAYLFLTLFPEFTTGSFAVGARMLFMSVLIGFALFHLVEKYIYQHVPGKKILRDLAIEDSVISFVYHFMAGIVLFEFVKIDLNFGILFFIPILIHTSVSTLPVDTPKNNLVAIILASSTFFGVLFASYAQSILSASIIFILMGFVAGTLLFTLTRHTLPAKEQGSPLFFLVGIFVYVVIISLMEKFVL
jgi:hypothetical protein